MYQYPYGNAQQLNLDWILGKIKELESGSGGGGADLEEVANALVSASFDAGVSYRRYDYCFYNGKLYRALNDTTGAFNPSDWLEVVIGDDIPVLTRLLNAVDASLTTLQGQVADLDSDDVDNASNVTGTTVTAALDNLNGAITNVVEVSDTQPTSSYNEIWIPATATPTVEIPTVAELNAVADPEVENLSATVTFTTGAKGTLYKKGFVYRVDVGIQTRTEFTPASNSMVTLGTLPSSARMSGSVYVPAVYRSNNSDPLTATYAGIYANGNVALFVNTTSPIYLAMVAIGVTYFKF